MLRHNRPACAACLITPCIFFQNPNDLHLCSRQGALVTLAGIMCREICAPCSPHGPGEFCHIFCTGCVCFCELYQMCLVSSGLAQATGRCGAAWCAAPEPAWKGACVEGCLCGRVPAWLCRSQGPWTRSGQALTARSSGPITSFSARPGLATTGQRVTTQRCVGGSAELSRPPLDSADGPY